MSAPILPSRQANGEVPRLQNGDKLTREEFEHRYHAMPPATRAELIEGVVYLMSSPVRLSQHGSPQIALSTWIGTYQGHTLGLHAGSDATVRLDLDNEPQPDVSLMIAPSHGGQVAISDDDYIEGAPDFVAEVSASTASIDLHAKLHAYQRNGVREYLVWRVLDDAFDWFVLRHGRFEAMTSPENGILKSEVFPGLWLDTAAMLRHDILGVLQTLQQGLASLEHSAFVADLAARVAAKPPKD
jgi:Uma2 family endonuclease